MFLSRGYWSSFPPQMVKAQIKIRTARRMISLCLITLSCCTCVHVSEHVCVFFCRTSRTPPPPPPPHHIPKELSSWIAALSLQPVTLRDTFWSAVDADRPVSWDDNPHVKTCTQTGTWNVTRLPHPSTPAPASIKYKSTWPNLEECAGMSVSEGHFSLFAWALLDVMQPRVHFRIVPTYTFMVSSVVVLRCLRCTRWRATYDKAKQGGIFKK